MIAETRHRSRAKMRPGLFLFFSAFLNVAIRGKGNTSLSSVKSMGSQRCSFKIEFDQYEGGKSYHGLDKLSLNNIIQDNTYMKDYLSYRLMREFGVETPLCSFAYITVNGSDWGLYLAVEGVEDSFLQRIYGRDTGELYKPDSMSFGGGFPGGGNGGSGGNGGFPGGGNGGFGPPENGAGGAQPTGISLSGADWLLLGGRLLLLLAGILVAVKYKRCG